jgi:hypothetical protein
MVSKYAKGVKMAYKSYNKYSNKKTKVDGITFDSKKEAKRYKELKLLEKAGVIKDLELQPKFLIVDTLRKNGKTFKKRSYIADFMYYDNERKKTVVEDVKGYKAKLYPIKRHLFEQRYPNLWVEEI